MKKIYKERIRELELEVDRLRVRLGKCENVRFYDKSENRAVFGVLCNIPYREYKVHEILQGLIKYFNLDIQDVPPTDREIVISKKQEEKK